MSKINLQNAAEALKIKEQVEVLTYGRSMEPLLKEHRDIAVISHAKAPVKNGDIVLYTRDNKQFILHRIVKIRGEKLVIRGDNNLFYEKDIKKEDIIGILTALYRKGKYMEKGSVQFKWFALFNKLRFPVIFVYRKTKQYLWKKLKGRK